MLKSVIISVDINKLTTLKNCKPVPEKIHESFKAVWDHNRDPLMD